MDAFTSIIRGIREIFGQDEAVAFAVQATGLAEDGGKGSGNNSTPKSYHPDLVEAAHKSKTPAEFWYNMPESEKGNYKSIEEIRKAHEDILRTTEAPEQSKWQADLEKKKQKALSWDSARQAEYLFRHGFLDEDSAINAMRNGTAGKQMERYFAIQESNGDN